ncbi:DUF3570 domain-containing protein [Methylomonas sp. AM2-LC]|uniref:DUF3570 domain-containing protein n=1 Tax=Methylomonas sp. AM2-LC TaxID=3153301 RepID=UPI003264670A
MNNSLRLGPLLAKPVLANHKTLKKFTASALALPGIFMAVSCLADDETEFQYSHYQETKRNLYGQAANNSNPIEVDSLNGAAKFNLNDRTRFGFNFTQDTWGGATPISTAPFSVGLNHVAITNHIAAGASPYIQALGGAHIDLNTGKVVKAFGDPNPDTGIQPYIKDTQLVQTIASASPETRKQGDFKLSYDWDESQLDIGGGISLERDYTSRYGNIGGRWDVNQKLTSLNYGLSYTNSDTNALMNHDSQSYIFSDYYQGTGQMKSISTAAGTEQRLQSNRQDFAGNLGFSQILNKDAVFQTNLGFSQSSGYLANPYKVVETFFIDRGAIHPPGYCDFNLCDTPPNVVAAVGYAYLEKRPDVRNQWTVSSRYVQYIKPLDAALHFEYSFSSDDWGIKAHTFSSDWVQPLGGGWSVTPKVRYYSQDAASFYTPYLFVNQVDAGEKANSLKLPANYSSDQRLSAFGTLSGGISVSKQFAKGITFETGFEYYTHAGSLKLGGGGEGDYANYRYYVANASLKLNMSAIASAAKAVSSMAEGSIPDMAEDRSQNEIDVLDPHRYHRSSGHQHGAPIPAGVMFGHMLHKPGEFMLGYRYMYSTEAGNMLHGTNTIPDSTIVSQACGAVRSANCYLTPNNMNMHMHMLDLMYAPTDWLNLMLMPQFVDMNMGMRGLAGAPTPTSLLENHIEHHIQAGHSTGGVGDTGLYSLFKLYSGQGQHINLTLGATAPTGDVGIKLLRNHQADSGYIHYGMQLGSGTWDFKPSLTYTGQLDDWSWGAQISGTKRLQSMNSSGFAFGDIFQSTAWGSYSLFDWLSASVRGVYTSQGAVRNQFNGLSDQLGPMDFPRNYGGRYWDLGLGINASVIGGSLAGNKLSFEWLQPISTDVNGYQLDRNGALSATWGYAF